MAWCRNCDTTLEYDEVAEVWHDANGSVEHEVETWAHMWESNNVTPERYKATTKANNWPHHPPVPEIDPRT